LHNTTLNALSMQHVKVSALQKISNVSNSNKVKFRNKMFNLVNRTKMISVLQISLLFEVRRQLHKKKISNYRHCKNSRIDMFFTQ